ncbi:MAG: Fe(3+)-transporting ATPase [Acetothermia bacterium 64_32]|nr:MAG: Fe(3+)-transporting ATPase [Acetothermia bacterium 64_32]HAF71377.1 iron ABC transporter ATP-binding protein [Candidatus Acetothermia bacterium]
MRLAAAGLSYAYTPGSPVLNRVSLEVGEGDVLFLLGPNGSGKTTLLECLCGLRRPQTGRVLLGGEDLYGLPARERAKHVGYVPQIHRPVFGFRVIEVVLMGRAPHLGPFSSPRGPDFKAAWQALEAVGLSELARRPYTELSGGEMRLVFIARGLAQGARFLLLDEPDAHLDPNNQHEVLKLVRGLATEGLSPVVSSHNPNNALFYATRAALLREGELLSLGAPEAVLTPKALGRVYGMGFRLLVGEDGARALIPAQGRSSSSRSTGRERGSGSACSRAISENLSATAKGA